jgi:acyl-CoA synthetase (AMP-forming)/AMP-acid ligase II
VKGPHVTPDYWRSPELTAAAFDEDEFCRIGDAMRFADANDPAKGLIYDGRIAEEGIGSVVSGTIYALVDGVIGGAIFGWLYNLFAARKAE